MMTGFFVSYTGNDQAWAEWIAWQLEAAGYTVVVQAWDFKSGGVFPADMHHALEQCDRVLAVLSPNYTKSDYCKAEWLAAFKDDPTGANQRLVLVRIADCEPTGLLAGRTYIDLVNKSEPQAAALLLERLKPGRAKPATAPCFPGGAPAPTVKRAPVFPGLPPNNLPRLSSFFGRNAELAKIAAALDRRARHWLVLIDGPGGIGKTALAIRAAEQVPPDQFKRIPFLSAKEREMSADGERRLTDFVLPGYLDMLNEIARQLKRPDLSKLPEGERARLLIEALESQDVLFILDNLESFQPEHRDRLFNFLSRLPQGCKAIVTSRRRTDLGALIIRLEKLDQQAALDLLADLAPDRPLLAKTTAAERVHLYEETGGNPLLLRWVAGQLGRGQCRTVASALALLRSAPMDNDPLEFIFGDLLETFTETETKLLAALAHFTGAMEVKFIAELGGISRTAAQTALGDLAGRALVVPDEEERNFALVPMVADFLRRKRPEAVEQTGSRLADRAYGLIVENGYNKHDRFPVLDAAWLTVAPALSLFLAGPNPRLQTPCDGLRSFLEFTGRWDDWLSLVQQAETKAVAASDHTAAGLRAHDSGWVHFLREQANEVLACADRATAHWQTAQAGARERYRAIRLRGIGHRLKNDYPAAIAAYREALDLLRTLSTQSEHVACVLNSIASAEKGSGDNEGAERDFREALRVARAGGFKRGVAAYTGNLAALALDREDWPAAEALAREALSLSEQLGRQQNIAVNCYRIAKALVRQGKPAEALPYARRAVQACSLLGSSTVEKARATLAECGG
jgi:tetratricopeptide (TPR) repeat protein